MKLAELAKRSGSWLQGEGPLAGIVISSRVRLARNLAGYPFLSRCDHQQKLEIQEFLRQQTSELATAEPLEYINIDEAEALDQQLLVERHLISRQHAEANGARGMAYSASEKISIMINEEDHLRLQALQPGLRLDEAWQEVDALDDLFEAKMDYAFSSRLGYLTACPTNVGTGIRVSVMLHLPGLKMSGQMEKVIRSARDMHLAVRGLHGEGTQAAGDFYQVSNQRTLGASEQQIIDEFKNGVVPRIVDYEQKTRDKLLTEHAHFVDDKAFRALGTLQNARTISSEESLELLSHLRMGVTLDRVSGLKLDTLNELFLRTQAAHLQQIENRTMSAEERGVARAKYIR
ncbi:MAG: protein arginine kinase, partial [Phycisphaerae bacterium]|nr:protein arginine kinase [Phycisphaerae bacterium]